VANLYSKHEKVEGKFKCKFCDKSYAHTRDLKKHYKSKHPVEVDEQPPDAFKGLDLYRRGRKTLQQSNEERKLPSMNQNTPVSFETLEIVRPFSMRVVCLA
jgi:hypothetical protein